MSAVATDELSVPGVYEIGNSAKVTLPARASASARTSAIYGSADVALRDVASIELGLRGERSTALPSGHDGYLNTSIGASFAFAQAMPVLRFGGFLTDGVLRGQWGRASNARRERAVWSASSISTGESNAHG